jgi:hypothetical protein
MTCGRRESTDSHRRADRGESSVVRPPGLVAVVAVATTAVGATGALNLAEEPTPSSSATR